MLIYDYDRIKNNCYYMGGGLIGLTKIADQINGLTDLCQMIDDVNCPENNSVIFIEKMKTENNFSYLIMFGAVLLLSSCKQNKHFVAIKLLEIYDTLPSKDDFFVKLFSHTDNFNKTALNYAVNNNMKHVASKILELKKKHKHVNDIIFSIFNDNKLKTTDFQKQFNDLDESFNKKIKIIPFESKFTYVNSNHNNKNIYSFALDPNEYQPTGSY